jgi:hypothetical protein
MSTPTLHPLATDYLRRLHDAARVLPRAERRELLSEIEAHLREATAVGASDVEVLGVLERLGEPEEIVDAHLVHAGATETSRQARAGAREHATIVLLLVGGFVGGIGWIAGLVLLWGSPVWRTREKWLGTLVIPGGLAVPGAIALALATATAHICRGVVGGPRHCTAAPGIGLHTPAIVLLAMLMLASLATGIYLARQAR